MVIFNSFSRNIFWSDFFVWFWSTFLFKLASLSSRFNLISFSRMILVVCKANDYQLTPLYAPIMTTNNLLFFVIQVCWSLRRNDFPAWWVIAFSSSERTVCFSKSNAFQVMEEWKFFIVKYYKLVRVFIANTLKPVNYCFCVSPLV